MADTLKQQASSAAVAAPLTNTGAPVGEALLEHEIIHNKTASITSDGTEFDKQLPKGDNARRPSLSRVTSNVEYPPTPQVVAIMVAILLAVFLVALDRTIIATAIPKMTDDFHSLDDIGWYGSAFMLTSSCFQLLFGRVYTFYPPKYVFVILIGLFEVGSAICGAAPNSIAFIIGRAIAGVGTAGIMSGAIILMVAAVPLHKRPQYQGFFGLCFGVASITGPLLGGVFTTKLSWRWCFYINLPVGAVAMLIILLILKPTPAQDGKLTIGQQLAKLDLLGELCLFPCIICLLLALQWGGTTYAWNDGRIIALFVLFGVLLVAFVLVQVFMQKTATISASVIMNRSVVAGMWMVFCLSSCMMALIYFIPTWFQAVKGTSALRSGIDTIPMVLALVVGSIMSGQGVGRIGYYTPFAIASAIFMPLGAGFITTWKPNTRSPTWIGFQVLFGFGTGLGMQQGGMAAQTVLSRKDVPMGVSLMFFCQQLGGAIFISVGQNVFESKLVSELIRLVPDLSPEEIVNTGATDLRRIVSPQDLPAVLEVYNSALRQVFVVAAAMACLAAIGAFALEWKSVKSKQGLAKTSTTDGKHEADSELQQKAARHD
ncbi:hypothetical protein LTR08_002931 [Meristemomyces frigidus]|nr:hypothetical protein LTR08_002931 [Meristemomyces frigidus]